MKRIEEFYISIVAQTEKYHKEQPSTFAVATLLYPPKFCWFPDNGPLPYEGYNNKLTMMRELNDRIMAFNNRVFKEQEELYKAKNYGWCAGDRSSAPKFHTYGLRKDKNTGHRWEWWRQTEEDSNKLHLADKHRCKMGKAVGNYFSHMFEQIF